MGDISVSHGSSSIQPSRRRLGMSYDERAKELILLCASRRAIKTPRQPWLKCEDLKEYKRELALCFFEKNDRDFQFLCEQRYDSRVVSLICSILKNPHNIDILMDFSDELIDALYDHYEGDIWNYSEQIMEDDDRQQRDAEGVFHYQCRQTGEVLRGKHNGY